MTMSPLNEFTILFLLLPLCQSHNGESISQNMNLLWWIVADKIDGFGPNLSPHIHVVTQINSTANATAGGPDQLQKNDKAERH